MHRYSRQLGMAGLAVVLLLATILLFLNPGSPGSEETGSAGKSAALSGAPSPVYVDYPVPERVTLCGEAFPLHVPDVYERMDMELTVAVHGPIQVFLWMKRAGRYFPYIEKRLAQEGLPDDLKYLAVAESDLRPQVSSPARATGTWQFMTFTGTRYGLRHDQGFDDRLNFERSTEAAIRYLRSLYQMFGKWSLAMAAYNCGEGCVGKEIQEQGVSDYFRLDLPNETERYVYRIAAIKIILENPTKYGFVMPKDHAYQPLKVDQIRVELGQEVHLAMAARAVGMDYKGLKELNPEILGRFLPKGSYTIAVPVGLGERMTTFLRSAAGPTTPIPAPAASPGTPAAPETTSPKPAVKIYTVKPGDTLNRISQQTEVPVETLRKLNAVDWNHLPVGQKIRLAP